MNTENLHSPLKEGAEGVKWQLGVAYFLVAEKWNSIHWDWDDGIHQQTPIKNGNGIKI